MNETLRFIKLLWKITAIMVFRFIINVVVIFLRLNEFCYFKSICNFIIYQFSRVCRQIVLSSSITNFTN